MKEDESVKKIAKWFRYWKAVNRWHSVANAWKVHPDSRRLRHRFKVESEIVSTESSFVNSLITVKQVYLDPARTSNTISLSAIGRIFNNWDIILNLHSAFLSKLKEERREPLAQIFTEFLSFFPVYTQYVNNYNRAMSTLNHAKQIPSVSAFFKQCRNHIACANMELESFLIMPVQRIPRYELLLRDLVKHTDDVHVDKAALESTLVKFKELSVSINERKREAEQLERVSTIFALFSEDAQLVAPLNELVAEGRSVIREGPLYRISRKHSGKRLERHAVLFNDLLLIAEWSNKDCVELILHSCHRLNEINSIDVVSDSKNTLKIDISGHSDNGLTFCFASQGERDGWYRDLDVFCAQEQERVLSQEYETFSWEYGAQQDYVASPRFAHTMSAFGNMILVFGGQDLENNIFADLYQLDTESNRWSAPVLDHSPCPRLYHTAVAVEDPDRLVVFGGYDGNARLNDCWYYNLLEERWTSVTCQGTRPDPRSSHSAAVVKSKMYLFGGRDSEGRFLNDLWVLDFSNVNATCEWRQITQKGEGGVWPDPRAWHSSVSVGTHIYVIGGFAKNLTLNDAWRFDTIFETWDLVESPGTGRYACAADVVGRRIFLSGGVHGVGSFHDDLIIYDTDTDIWSTPRLRHSTGPVSFHSMQSVGGQLVLFGGKSDLSSMCSGDPYYMSTTPVQAQEMFGELKWQAEARNSRSEIVKRFADAPQSHISLWKQNLINLQNEQARRALVEFGVAGADTIGVSGIDVEDENEGDEESDADSDADADADADSKKKRPQRRATMGLMAMDNNSDEEDDPSFSAKKRMLARSMSVKELSPSHDEKAKVKEHDSENENDSDSVSASVRSKKVKSGFFAGLLRREKSHSIAAPSKSESSDDADTLKSKRATVTIAGSTSTSSTSASAGAHPVETKKSKTMEDIETGSGAGAGAGAGAGNPLDRELASRIEQIQQRNLNIDTHSVESKETEETEDTEEESVSDTRRKTPSPSPRPIRTQNITPKPESHPMVKRLAHPQYAKSSTWTTRHPPPSLQGKLALPVPDSAPRPTSRSNPHRYSGSGRFKKSQTPGPAVGDFGSIGHGRHGHGHGYGHQYQYSIDMNMMQGMGMGMGIVKGMGMDPSVEEYPREVTCKLYRDDDVRVTTISLLPAAFGRGEESSFLPSFSVFSARVRAVYSDLDGGAGILDDVALKLRFKDDEDDLRSMNTTLDLVSALASMEKRKEEYLRLWVTRIDKSVGTHTDSRTQGQSFAFGGQGPVTSLSIETYNMLRSMKRKKLDVGVGVAVKNGDESGLSDSCWRIGSSFGMHYASHSRVSQLLETAFSIHTYTFWRGVSIPSLNPGDSLFADYVVAPAGSGSGSGPESESEFAVAIAAPRYPWKFIVCVAPSNSTSVITPDVESLFIAALVSSSKVSASGSGSGSGSAPVMSGAICDLNSIYIYKYYPKGSKSVADKDKARVSIALNQGVSVRPRSSTVSSSSGPPRKALPIAPNTGTAPTLSSMKGPEVHSSGRIPIETAKDFDFVVKTIRECII